MHSDSSSNLIKINFFSHRTLLDIKNFLRGTTMIWDLKVMDKNCWLYYKNLVFLI